MRLLDIVTFHAKDTTSQNLKMTVHDLPVTIEHMKGTKRTLHDDSGKKVYEKQMLAHYGYINNTKGRDGDEVDCFVGPFVGATEAHIIHMVDKGPVASECEDEDKVFLQYPSADSAKAAFLAHYPKNFYGGMTSLPVAEFKKKLQETQLPYRKKKITAGGPGSGRHKGFGVEEDHRHPEFKKAVALLKKSGYSGYGRTAAAVRGYDKNPDRVENGMGVHDKGNHRVWVNRYTGHWDDTSEKHGRSSGTDSASLAQRIKLHI